MSTFWLLDGKVLLNDAGTVVLDTDCCCDEGEAGCPIEAYCDSTCANQYTVTVTTGTCGKAGNCDHTYTLTRSDSCATRLASLFATECTLSYCNWCGDDGGNCQAEIACCPGGVTANWNLYVGATAWSQGYCQYSKASTTSSCPSGNYSLAGDVCSDCDETATVYAV